MMSRDSRAVRRMYDTNEPYRTAVDAVRAHGPQIPDAATGEQARFEHDVLLALVANDRYYRHAMQAVRPGPDGLRLIGRDEMAAANLLIALAPKRRVWTQ